MQGNATIHFNIMPFLYTHYNEMQTSVTEYRLICKYVSNRPKAHMKLPFEITSTNMKEQRHDLIRLTEFSRSQNSQRIEIHSLIIFLTKKDMESFWRR